jgi:hypothetical protein
MKAVISMSMSAVWKNSKLVAAPKTELVIGNGIWVAN